MHCFSPIRFRAVMFAFMALSFSWLSVGGLAATAKPVKLVVLGDSLTAGFHLPQGAGFPEQLELRLLQRGHKVQVVNAGVSGDTTAAGLARLDWAVPRDADAVIVELGANDALRGIPVRVARQNLEQIISRLKRSGKKVLLAGIESPRNLGKDYVEALRSMYQELASKHGLMLYPHFLKGVTLRPKLLLPDRLHPNQQGVKVMVRNMLPIIEQFLAGSSSDGKS